MRKKRKIVLSANTCWNLVKFRRSLIEELLGNEHEVIAMAPADDCTPQLVDMGCRHVDIPMDRKGMLITKEINTLFYYWRALNEIRPDVFLGFTIKPNIYGSLVAHALGIPVINNITGLGTAFIHQGWTTRLVKLLYRLILPRSHRVFFQNAEDLKLFVQEKLVRESQTGLLPGSGVNLQHFQPQDLTTNGRNQETVTFLMVARLIRDKGVHEYANAARIVRQRGGKAAFWLLGPLDVGNRTAISRQQITQWEQEGILRYLGVATDVRPHLAAASCIVLPSYREGMSRTLLEAAAMGKPIIATDVPGCREVVCQGVNGFLCRPRDERHLAATMLQYIQLPPVVRDRMGKASRKIAEARFDERIVIECYMEALATALSQRDDALSPNL